MQQRESSVIFKELAKVKKRIAAEKADLKKQLEKLEAEQNGEKPKGFTLNAVMNSSRTTEENARLIESIKAALELPYYADSEYRRLSVEYLETTAAEAAAAFEKKKAEVEAAEKALAAAQAHLEHLKAEKENIIFDAKTKIENIDISGVSNNWRSRPIDYVVRKYKNICSKYN